MNVVLIILIIVILVIVLYTIYYLQRSIPKTLDLNTETMTIANKDIVNPKSVRSSYGLWVYVNSWSIRSKTICLAQIPNSTTNFKLYLDENSPVLKCDVRTIDKTNITQTVAITNNFPVQRWVYIVVSIDGPVVDCYLDGKLVKSQQLTNQPDMDGLYTISCGTFDAYVTSVSRVPIASDPQTVWNDYMAGNGHSPILSSPYGVALSITKDNKEIAGYKY